jgi:hypothetical protein
VNSNETPQSVFSVDQTTEGEAAPHVYFKTLTRETASDLIAVSRPALRDSPWGAQLEQSEIDRYRLGMNRGLFPEHSAVLRFNTKGVLLSGIASLESFSHFRFEQPHGCHHCRASSSNQARGNPGRRSDGRPIEKAGAAHRSAAGRGSRFTGPHGETAPDEKLKRRAGCHTAAPAAPPPNSVGTNVPIRLSNPIRNLTHQTRTPSIVAGT